MNPSAFIAVKKELMILLDRPQLVNVDVFEDNQDTAAVEHELQNCVVSLEPNKIIHTKDNA